MLKAKGALFHTHILGRFKHDGQWRRRGGVAEWRSGRSGKFSKAGFSGSGRFPLFLTFCFSPHPLVFGFPTCTYQAILVEFDADGAPEESDLIRFFCEGLKPSIKAQIEQRGRELDSWDELVEKAIDAEAKARLQPASILCEIDRLAHEIIAPLILPWPKPRHYWLENLETSPPPPSNRPRLEISLNLRTSRPP